MNSEKWSARFCGVLLITGALLFLWGGLHHPRTTAGAMGAGPQQYFASFVRTIQEAHDWQQMHAFVLIGPVLWALGGCTSFGRRPWDRLAISALAMGAVAWAVTFVIDGFVAPVIVFALTGQAAIEQLMINQQMVIRIGLVSWLLIGVSAVSASLGMLLDRNASLRVIGALGVVAGGLPLIAWTTGNFLPGPFTSPYWGYSALAMALWFLLVGARLLVSPLREEAEAA